ESINITQVVSAMKSEGEAFGEVFSSMLAMDGALIRREHDLSKVDFVVDVDNKYTERNEQIAGQVSGILGMMAMISGEINHMLQRMSAETRNALTEARQARQTINSAASQQTAAIENHRTTLTERITSNQRRIEGLIVEIETLKGVPVDEIDATQAPQLRDANALDALIDYLSQVGPLTEEAA